MSVISWRKNCFVKLNQQVLDQKIETSSTISQIKTRKTWKRNMKTIADTPLAIDCIMIYVRALLLICFDHVRNNKAMMREWANNLWIHCILSQSSSKEFRLTLVYTLIQLTSKYQVKYTENWWLCDWFMGETSAIQINRLIKAFRSRELTHFDRISNSTHGKVYLSHILRQKVISWWLSNDQNLSNISINQANNVNLRRSQRQYAKQPLYIYCLLRLSKGLQLCIACHALILIIEI